MRCKARGGVIASYGDDEQHVRQKKSEQALCSAPAMASKIVQVIPARCLRMFQAASAAGTMGGSVSASRLRQIAISASEPTLILMTGRFLSVVRKMNA
jgi:hypothetical protein